MGENLEVLACIKDNTVNVEKARNKYVDTVGLFACSKAYPKPLSRCSEQLAV